MNTINDGGPAFPLAPSLHEGDMDSYWTQHPQPGMTLRDYFAAKAMQGLLASPETAACSSPHPEVVARERLAYARGTARAAYRYADAMLAEREKAVQP